MSYSSTVVEVLIASPSDVLKERELVTQAIYEWNASNSKYEGIVNNDSNFPNFNEMKFPIMNG
ncbi:hypothetical protein BKK39_09220 [Bacillus cereus]|nr:hypothetical protein BKK39_09220 [Bacillus cereus]